MMMMMMMMCTTRWFNVQVAFCVLVTSTRP